MMFITPVSLHYCQFEFTKYEHNDNDNNIVIEEVLK